MSATIKKKKFKIENEVAKNEVLLYDCLCFNILNFD